MASKNIDVNLNFNTNTTQALTNIQQLSKELTLISAGTNLNINSESISKASAAAKDLQVHLSNALNANTGKLDLSKLNSSLAASKQNLKDLAGNLLQAGVQGEQAFVRLAQSIAAADRPMISLGSKMKSFGTTMMNTVKWQISSSVLHGFIRSISTAYNYSKDLNESLTSIRIVTGKTVEDMEQFAVQANKAAQALSSTTNEYAKAALIYYQQGLDGKVVEERTNATIKMANVTGQNAETVSDQMTAIWNNFDNGSKSLEYYADVMTALGASTASSTDEIAQGLEKFAAVAETVGLSYEYATSALATVTATTRQSADVVGTAFKTLFARIQDLELGNTLDDGTTLGSYSEALYKVGINIKDSNGELKKMDTILEEMGAKWQQIDKDQQVALAKSVAGIRQYTQLIALMENWSFMQTNLNTAKNSEGTLSEQAKIYEESWEAASNRVRASLETVYSEIIDDQFFISITNGFASLTKSLGAFIQGIGGLKPLLIGIGSMFLSSVAHKIGPALNELKHNFLVVFSTAEKQAKMMTASMTEAINQATTKGFGGIQIDTQSSLTALDHAKQTIEAKNKLYAVERNMTTQEKQRWQQELSTLEILQEENQVLADSITKTQQEIDAAAQNFDYEKATVDVMKERNQKEEELIQKKREAATAFNNDPSRANQKSYNTAIQELREYQMATERLTNAREQYTKSLYNSYVTEMESTKGQIQNSTTLLSLQSQMPDVVNRYTKALAGMQSTDNIDKQRTTFARLKEELELITGNSCPELTKALDKAFASVGTETFKKNVNEIIKVLKNAQIPAKDLEKILSQMGQKSNVVNLRKNYQKMSFQLDQLRKKQANLNATLEQFNPTHVITGLERVTQAAAGLGQVAMLATSVRSIFNAWNNDDLSFGEKLTTTFMSLSMIVPAVLGVFKSFNIVLGGFPTQVIAAVGAQKAFNAALQTEEAQLIKNHIQKNLDRGMDKQKVLDTYAQVAVKKGLIAEEEKELFIEKLLSGEKQKGAAITMFQTVVDKLSAKATSGSTVAKLLLNVAEKMGIVIKVADTAATGAQTVANYALQASMWPILAIGLLLMAAMASLALVIWGIVSAVNAMSDAYNADAIAAEEAAQAAKDLAQTYNEVKQQFEALKESLSNYKEAKNAIDDLTTGSLEWKQALQDANLQALELMKKYPELRQYADLSGDVIKISDTGLEMIKQKEASRLDSAYAANIAGATMASKAQLKSDTTGLYRDMFGYNPGTTMLNQEILNVAASLLPGKATLTAQGVGTAVNAATGAINLAQLVKGDDAMEAALELADTNMAAFENFTDFSKALKDQGVVSNNLIETLWNNRDAILELSSNINAHALELKAASRSIVESTLSGVNTVQQSEYKDAVISAITGTYDERLAQYTEAYTNEMKDSKEDFAKEYAQLIGVATEEGFKVSEYTDSGVVYSYLDEEGERQEKEVTYNQMVTGLATNDLDTEVVEAAANLAKLFKGKDLSQDEANTYAALTSGEQGSISQDNLNTIKQAGGIEEYLKSINMAPEDLISNYDEIKTNPAKDRAYDQALSAYGINIDVWKATMTQASQELDKIKKEMLELGISSNQLKTVMQSMSVDEAKNFQEAMQSYVNFYGEEAGVKMASELSNLQKSMDEESFGKFTKEFAKIEDYTDAKAWENLVDSMEDAEHLTEEEAEALKEYAEQAAEAANAIKNIDLTVLTEQFKKLSDISKKAAEGNIEYSEEEMAVLQESGVGTENFVKTLDGTYRYLGTASNLSKEIANEMADSAQEVVTNYRRATDLANQARANVQEQEAESATATETFKSLQQIISKGFSWVVNQVTTGIKAFWEDMASIFLGIYDSFVDIWNSVGEDITNIWNSILETFVKIYNGIADLASYIGINMREIDYTNIKINFEKAKTSDEIAEEAAEEESHREAVEAIQTYADVWSGTSLLEGYEDSAKRIQELEAKIAKETDATKKDNLKKQLKREEELLEAWDTAIASKAQGYEDLQPLVKQYNEAVAAGNEAMAESLRIQLANGTAIKDAESNLENFIEKTKEEREAVEDLGIENEAAQKYLEQMAYDFGFDNITEGAEFLKENFNTLQSAIEGDVAALQTLQENLLLEWGLTGSLDTAEILNGLHALGSAANDTLEALLSTGQFRLETIVAENDIEVPEIITDSNGYPQITGKKIRVKAGSSYTVLKPLSGNSLETITRNLSTQTSSDNSDSSPAEKVEKTKRSDVVNRYEEIEDKLDDVRDAADKAASAMDRLYGANRIKAMKDQAKVLKDEVGLLKDKRKWAEQYLKEDTNILAETATEAGVRLEFDENDNVTNYTEQMDRLWKQLNDAENKKAGMGTKEEQDEFDETHIQSIQDAIDALKDAYDQYEDTREEIEDLDTEIQEAIYAWQDANAEILNYEIEIKTELNERELKKLDYYLGKMEDDFYSMAESAALVGEKIKITNSALADSQINFDNINKLYNTIDEDTGARGMSDEAYVEALKNEQDVLYDNLKTLQELDDTMMNYYGDTLSMAQEELTKYTDRMDHSTSILDHYRSLLDLTGQSQNFKAIGTILEGQVKAIENSYQVAKQNYEWLADEAIKKKQAMNDALARGDAEAAELYENEWKAAEEKMRESQENMLSMSEEWAGKLKEVLENKLAEIADVLENALTGGRSFDELSMQMEHAQGIQEEYLTTTNKIYETNKMIRNAQNEIDKTTNTVAKQKLKAFQQETQQLQNQGQLSQFELDIQQKKYDLLLAQIALEEAQNAKSTVRLQRDSEGNFGYIYTADQNQVSGAEQGVEDAENALYNTRLEGANNYASQRQELLQGLYDSLTNLDNQYYIEGAISEEEYNRQKEAIQSYYFEKLAQNSELYAIATGEDAAISQEAWSTSLGIMDEDIRNLVETVDNYLSKSQTAFNQYQTGINKVAKETGIDLDTLASNVKNITDESDNLKKKVKDEIIPELQNELNKVSEVTGKYTLHRNELALVMESYENLLEDIGNVITEMGKLAGKCDSVKTKAEQAASAVGSIGNIGTYASSNTGNTTDTNSTPRNSYTGYYLSGKWDKFSAGQELKANASVRVTEIANGSLYYCKVQSEDGKISGWLRNPETALSGFSTASWVAGSVDRSKYYTLDYKKLDTHTTAYDTGGYTGEWGPEGKWALLHQKELVLNAHQTEDLLMTMELLDSILKQIDMMTMNNKISQMHAAMNEAVNAMYREQMAQEIHIEANFPNATDRNEIYQAFEMLANDTSQFINR